VAAHDPQTVQQRLDRQALKQNGEKYYAKRDRDQQVSLRERRYG